LDAPSPTFLGAGSFSALTKAIATTPQVVAESAAKFEPPIYNIWKWREGKFHNLFTIPARKMRFSPLS
jgi:hypothetical protein